MSQVVMITGAGKGIGRATARLFAESGWAVSLCDWDEIALRQVEQEIQTLPADVLAFQLDVSDEVKVGEWTRVTLETFGRVDAACNNAGIGGESFPMQELPKASWDKVLGVNLTGPWLCMREQLKVMLDQGSGSIINVASILGVVGYENASAYVAAKHGLVGITRAAALEVAPKGIRVNAVCPGFIETPMLEKAGITTDPEVRRTFEALHPLGRFGLAEEVAEAVYWLAMPEASFVTGHTLMVDGGYTTR